MAFRFLLVREEGQPNDPAVFETAEPNWTVGQTFLLAPHERFRILRIDPDFADELFNAGINAVFIVEPCELRDNVLPWGAGDDAGGDDTRSPL